LSQFVHIFSCGKSSPMIWVISVNFTKLPKSKQWPNRRKWSPCPTCTYNPRSTPQRFFSVFFYLSHI
jgi:hypothetical protein